MCWIRHSTGNAIHWKVSVAGCLGYDVLARLFSITKTCSLVSVAGCLGYDVLVQKILY